jgi:hypothetical protein
MTRPENEWLDDEAGPVVRPYALTRGRTRPTSKDFDLIAIIAATATSSFAPQGAGPEHYAILELCVRPLSVAEISAKLRLPLGVVRILLSDLLDHGLIVVRKPTTTMNQTPDANVIKEVLHGLKAL